MLVIPFILSVLKSSTRNMRVTSYPLERRIATNSVMLGILFGCLIVSSSTRRNSGSV
jgi:hypothetical protein